MSRAVLYDCIAMAILVADWSQLYEAQEILILRIM